jgi:hypothetical protein
MRNLSPSVKKGIISSLIATILFLYFLDPILNFLGKIFLKVGAWLFQSYLDRLYQEMAVDSMDYAYLIFLSIVIAMITIGSLIIFRVIFKNRIDTTDHKLDTKNRSKTLVVLYVTFFFTCIFLLTTSSINKKTTSSFNQHLRIITPYITTQEKDLIISEFASMKSQKDYRMLYDKINAIAVKNELELPKNKLYIF